MDAASCGPSSALQNLSKHTQRDTSLQHQRHGGPSFQQQGQGQGPHLFRQGQQRIDQNLNQEFQQFNSGGHYNQVPPVIDRVGLAPNAIQQPRGQPQGFQPTLHRPPPPPPQQQQQQQQFQYQQSQKGWVDDFSKMNIHNQQLMVQQRNSWGQEFQQNHQHAQQVSHHHQQQQQQQQPQLMQNRYIGSSYGGGMMNMQRPMTMGTNTASPQFHQQSEHQQVHKLEDQETQLESEFDAVEKELQEVESSMQETNLHDKDLFAQTARKVESSMNSLNTTDAEMKSKFENSEFLKLMNRVANKQVELQDDKLVDVEGEGKGKGEEEHKLEIDNSDGLQQQGVRNTDAVDYHDPMHQTADFNDWDNDLIPNYPPPLPQQQQQQKRQQRSHHSSHASSSSPPPPPAESKNKLPDPLAHLGDGLLEGVIDPLAAARIISGGQVQTEDWVDSDSHTDWLSLDTPTIRPQVRPWRKGQIVDHHWDEMYRDYRNDDDFH
ncbi:hypothetical protein LELG_04816 [Lodderomyces elongisporus NRRL YB-4239]|uniref:Uncharacterized protein n=1 Tax=Lodderomyces elongisporus (strain ATCC 11503 / CBS 2605 / JCM 1781 / NBRC 1676 / NRRL YB-4239) TaxID=379508 RepID=A5E5C7_LODEL|nr:hypothetical protein LELG_04816 [Lodderomyces elongisporus NRRL YB-4239]